MTMTTIGEKIIRKIALFFKRVYYHGKYVEEILYWDAFLANKGEVKDEVYGRIDKTKYREIFSKYLLKEVKKINRKHPRSKLHLLEVGSGPVSSLGWGVDNKLFTVSAVDPLADEYAHLLKKYDIHHPVKPVQASGETMMSLFAKNHFDIVYSRNALDHTDSAVVSFQNMVALCKKGGIIFIEGRMNETTRRTWRELHQHNLMYENKTLYDSDRYGIKTDMTRGLHLKYTFGNLTGSWFTVVFQKIR